MSDAVAREFASPGSAWRSKPFWSWNGDLQPEELRRQIRVMRRMGMGGFFMHARVGLATPYLSKRWFECVNACVDEAKELKMEAWLYDEEPLAVRRGGRTCDEESRLAPEVVARHRERRSREIPLDA